MGIWKSNMTAADFEANHDEWRNSQRRNLIALKRQILALQDEVVRLEKLVDSFDEPTSTSL